ncbi:MAG: Fe(3+) ABC transporter substrate-binding protein [Aestuariibacter sp.]
MKSMMIRTLVCSLLTVCSLAQAAEVNVYSARKDELIKPLLDKFEKATGIEVNLVTGKADALLSRMQSEGEYSPVDVLLTTDVGRLERAKALSLIQSVNSDVLEKAIAKNFRDSEGYWYALTKRARTIMYHPERVKVAELNGILDLADEKWKGRICVRSSNNIYNQSLVSAMLIKHDEATVTQWAEQFVSNFARSPKGGDRDQIKAVVAGECDVAIANSYYLAGMLRDSNMANVDIAKQVSVFWPADADKGTHVNISGAAVAQHAPNKESAIALLEFLVKKDSQQWYAEHNHEYPVMDNVPVSAVLQSFGEFEAESVALDLVGENTAKAVAIMDKAGWK